MNMSDLNIRYYIYNILFNLYNYLKLEAASQLILSQLIFNITVVVRTLSLSGPRDEVLLAKAVLIVVFVDLCCCHFYEPKTLSTS